MRAPAWLDGLIPHAVRMADRSLPDLIAAEPLRIEATTLKVGPIYASFARQRIDATAWAALLQLARERHVEAAIAALFDGDTVNRSEQRSALHTALRSDAGATSVARQAHAQAQAAQRAMAKRIDDLRMSNVTDIINIGIGGSDLGPRLVLDALRDLDPGRFRVHFLSSADGHAIQQLQHTLEPKRTAAVLVSKSFGTRETLLNGARIRDWLGSNEHLFAVTANSARAEAFGVKPEQVLPLWDWVGGRYSIWSAVGLAVAAALSMDVFERMLAGAAQMDAHVRHTPLERNLGVRHGLTAIWNRNAMGYATHAILPYDERLSRLPSYLQQLVMESLGKSISQEGENPQCDTGPVIWGSSGGDAQHSFFQALHQGGDIVPVDFIGVARAHHTDAQLHRILLANLLAQAEALANGMPHDDPAKAHPGNRPSTILLLDELSPEALGALLALYEHSVHVQATIWGINPFDQWGVELGKTIATDVAQALVDPKQSISDSVTSALVSQIRASEAADTD